MIEVLTRLRLPIAPVEPDEVARKADITAAGAGSIFAAAAPPDPGGLGAAGVLWSTPAGELFVWTGSEWLKTGGMPSQGTTWDGDTTTWDGGNTTWDP